LDRYSRQIRFAPFGEAGQRHLAAARAAIIGCGALGTFHAAALARAGAGTIRIVDRDFVEWNNLQRQWLFDERDAAAATPKSIAAAGHLRRVNSTIVIEPVVADLIPSNAEALLADMDLILDGTDNFETRYLINDYAVSRGVPWIYGAALGSYGILMPVLPGDTCCLRCVYPEPPSGSQPTCETAGVLNTITATVAALQVSQALQILSGHRRAVPRRITTVDVWTGSIRQMEQPPRDAACPCCARGEYAYLHSRRRDPVRLCGRNAVQIHDQSRPLDLGTLARRLEPFGRVRAKEFALRFETEPYELMVFPDGRAIIKGTEDTGVARSLYARFVGI
jgi:adenylyltransferase/sulfurtransferase